MLFQRLTGFIIMMLLAQVFFAPYANAQGGLLVCPRYPEPCTLCDLFATGQRILNFMVSPRGGLVFVLSVIGIMIGGILILVSGGNQQLYTKGVFALKAALIGLAIALSAWIIVNTILVALTGSQQPEGFPWPWNTIRCS
jgi:hypothetical protein